MDMLLVLFGCRWYGMVYDGSFGAVHYLSAPCARYFALAWVFSHSEALFVTALFVTKGRI